MREKMIDFRFDEAKALAMFLAQLVREGVTFDVERIGNDGFRVILTGGY